jgi:hypothetical protein
LPCTNIRACAMIAGDCDASAAVAEQEGIVWREKCGWWARDRATPDC